ncbi:MAG TPA: valine--tRNA ligase [Thermoleophilia bacterium]|nr:valine--tRNA ligase [Thermoleophilia bacterium]
METRWDPTTQEASIFPEWEATGVFSGRPESGADPYVIAFPPPNITGELHMGHALNGSTQDTLIRLRRMQGRDTLWICGTDHASIAVHAVIDRQLRAEGTNRHDLGREAFLARVWEWRRTTGATIIGQLRALGCTLDYAHERFTMDEGYERAVLTMFARLYAKGYIYRDNRIINWCPTCASTISDLEVRHRTQTDTLYRVRYPVAGTDEVLEVATVRPETILADTAVAVHPDDPRYRHLVGHTAIVPIVDREVPIIADEYVRMDFGTGALKVTPGHDPNDFEIGRRHGLRELTVIGLDGRMNDQAGEFAGMPVAEAQQAVAAELDRRGLLAARTPYEHEVGHCDRTGDRVEPLISLQWFMRMDELARPANEAVRSGRVRFHPRSQENTYFNWMDDLRPWCISRQLWWGHQIPVWYCPDGHVTVAVEEPAACAECGSGELVRDQDVLDTWFSSALWPFATLGWPEQTERLARYYPGDVLSTARDIINLWVARMLMMGIEFMGEEPFEDVLIHSTIQAPDGRRMSKSLGTGIDPIELIRAYGADATRYGLLKMSSTQDVRFDRGAIEEGGKLANKLWNAGRFVLTSGREGVAAAPAGEELADRWIRSRLAAAQRDVIRLIDAFDFAAAVKTLYSFVWNDYCDWYIEACKPRLQGEDAEAAGEATANLRWVLERILALAHPVMPFVTERLWSHVAPGRGLLMLAAMPEPLDGHRDEAAEAAMRERVEYVAAIRRDPTASPTVSDEIATDPLVLALLPKRFRDAGTVAATPSTSSLEAQLAEARSELRRAEGMLASAGFLAKAPPHKIEEEREKRRRYGQLVEDIEARLASAR